MSALAAVTAFFTTVGQIFGWKTGGRTHEENKDRDELRKWEEEEIKALESGDTVHASFARRRILRLQQRTIAKSDR